MIGEKIKELRFEKKMTQKALADKLFVTAQAVSRWENGEVEPSISTITMLAKIFEISTDELLGLEERKPTVEERGKIEEEPEDTSFKKEEVRFPIARCNDCFEDIYDSSDIVRIKSGDDRGIKCQKCANRIIDERRTVFEGRIDSLRAEMAKKRRKRAMVTLILLTTIALIFGVVMAIANKTMVTFWFILQLYLLFVYPVLSWVYCIVLRNTFIGRMVYSIANFWKKLFGNRLEEETVAYTFFVSIPSGIFSIVSYPLAVLVYVVSSLLIYPYAIYKSLRYPDEIYIDGEFWDKSDEFMGLERSMIRYKPSILLDEEFFKNLNAQLNNFYILL